MSGGYFYGRDIIISEIADSIEREVETNNMPKDGRDANNFTPETLAIFRDTVSMLREMATTVHRIDYLLGSDDCEEEFRKRLKEELRGR